MDERDGEVTLDLSRKFFWREPDFEALRAVVRTQLQGRDSGSAYIELGGALGKTLRYTSIEGWLAALRSDAARLSLRADAGVLAVTFDVEPLRRALSVHVTTGELEAPAAEALIAAVARALALESWTERPRVSVTGRYVLERPDAAWLRETVTLALQFAAPVDRFSGQYRRQGDPHCEHEIGDLAAWTVIVTGPDPVMAWRASASGHTRHVDLSWSEEGGELTARVGAVDAAAATGWVSEFEQLRGLKPRDSESWSRRRGSKRSYLVKSRPDQTWITRLLAELQRATGASSSFEGRLRTREDREFTFNALESWSQKMAEAFADTIWLYAWISGRKGTVTLTLDLQRDVLEIELRSSNLDPDTALVQLAGMFELETVSGSPHRYRRFGSVYKLDSWPGNETYAAVVHRAITIAFGDRLPAVAEALVSQSGKKGLEELQPFYTIDGFLKRLRGTEEYLRASIVVQGPLSHNLAIHVDREKDELRLYANLERTQFRSVDALFSDKIDLTLNKKESADTNASTPRRFNILVPAIAAILVALVTSFSAQVFPLVRGSPRLEITWPGKPTDGKPLSVPRGAIRVAWRYVSPRPMGDALDYNAKASIIIVQQGATPWQWTTEASGETTIPTPPPGSFHVRVRALDASAEDNLDLLVQ